MSRNSDAHEIQITSACARGRAGSTTTVAVIVVVVSSRTIDGRLVYDAAGRRVPG